MFKRRQRRVWRQKLKVSRSRKLKLVLQPERQRAAAATGVHEFVETLAGSFIISGLEKKLDLQRYDNMVRRALIAVTNFTKNSGKGIIEVSSMEYHHIKLKPIAELPPVKILNDTKVDNTTELANNVTGKEEDLEEPEKVIDGDSTSLLIDLDESGVSLRVNFAIRSIRVERREWKEEAESKIKSLLPPAKIVPQVTNASVNASSNRSVEEVESLASAKQRYGNEKKRHARALAAFRSVFQGHGESDGVSARHQQVPRRRFRCLPITM